MSRIIVITGEFDVLDRQGHRTGRKEFGVSHGIEEDTGRTIVMSGDTPAEMGATFDNELGEWVIETQAERHRMR